MVMNKSWCRFITNTFALPLPLI